MVIEHARQGDDPGSSPPTFVTLSFSVFTSFENNSKCLGDALSLTACIRSECRCVMEFSRIYHDEINEVADFKFVAR